jgi:multiple sugar transport system permease protein
MPGVATTRRVSRTSWIRTGIGVLAVAIMLFPLYWMVNASLQTNAQIALPSPQWLPFGGTFDGYRDALSLGGGHLMTSLVVAGGTTLLTLLIAAPGAYAIGVLRARGAQPLILFLLVAQLIPGIVMANALFRIYRPLGLLNSVQGLILADTTLAVPFAVLILRAFMASIPRELIEASTMDGARPSRTLISVVLPLSRNALITSGLFAFLFAWGDFLFASTLNLGAENATPISVGLYSFLGAGVNTTSWNSVMATGVLASAPAAVLLIVAQRYIAAGVTSGAVKD